MVVGVESGEQLENLDGQAEVWLSGLRRLAHCGPASSVGQRRPLLAFWKGLPVEKALNRRLLLQRRIENLLQQVDGEGLSSPSFSFSRPPLPFQFFSFQL